MRQQNKRLDLWDTEAESFKNALFNKDLKTKTLLLITESDIWKINSDQVNYCKFNTIKRKKNKSLSEKNKKRRPNKKAKVIKKNYKVGKLVRAGKFLNRTSQISKSGIFLEKDGFKFIFQNALPIFLSRGTILNYSQGNFVLKKQILATLVNYTQQTEDIVQGLPKIEEIIEARVPKLKSYLSVKPGIFISLTSEEKSFIKDKKNLFPTYTTLNIKENIFAYSYCLSKEDLKIIRKQKKRKSIKLLLRKLLKNQNQ